MTIIQFHYAGKDQFVQSVDIDKSTFRAAPGKMTTEQALAARFNAQDQKERSTMQSVVRYLKSFCNITAQIVEVS